VELTDPPFVIGDELLALAKRAGQLGLGRSVSPIELGLHLRDRRRVGFGVAFARFGLLALDRLQHRGVLASQLFERAGLIECRLRHGGIASRASLGQVTVETCDLAAQLFLETPQLAGVIGLEAHHLLRVLAFQVADRGLVLRNIRAAKLLDGVFDRLGILRLELFAKLGECRITLVRRMVVQRRELGTVACDELFAVGA
jgi:hypothetical protein